MSDDCTGEVYAASIAATIRMKRSTGSSQVIKVASQLGKPLDEKRHRVSAASLIRRILRRNGSRSAARSKRCSNERGPLPDPDRIRGDRSVMIVRVNCGGASFRIVRSTSFISAGAGCTRSALAELTQKKRGSR